MAAPLVTRRAVLLGGVGIAAAVLTGCGLGSPAPKISAKLSWPVPQLMNPTRIRPADIPIEGLRLQDNEDVEILSGKMNHGLVITGGRNVVCTGIEVNVPNSSSGFADRQRRGIYLQGQTGTVHVEGTLITGAPTDGFVIDQRLGATVQIQMCRVENLRGQTDGNHADVIQTWAGPRILRVDHLSAVTNYQGLFIMPNQFEAVDVTEIDLRNIDIDGSGGGAYLLWVDPAVDRNHIKINNVYLNRASGASSMPQLDGTVFTAATYDRLPDTPFAPRNSVGTAYKK